MAVIQPVGRTSNARMRHGSTRNGNIIQPSARTRVMGVGMGVGTIMPTLKSGRDEKAMHITEITSTLS